MTAYLTARPPVRQQWYQSRNRPLTGATVLHTSESIMDSVGPDTGAENVAEFIRKRTDPGSYHDLVDSDSWIPLVDLKHAAFHDGTGSNNWALSISFACRTSDWAKMTPEKRRGFLHQGARAFANQQLYRQHIKAPLTRVRLITKAQSDAGQSGICCHGWRDPGRRSDPGVLPGALFPFDEFLAACRAELARVMPGHPDAARTPTPAPASTPQQEDDMPFTPAELGNITSDAIANRVIASVGGKPYHAWEAWRDAGLKGVDAQKLAAEIVAQLPASSGGGASKADVEAAVRAVFADAGTA